MINYLTLTGEGYCLTFRLEVLYVSIVRVKKLSILKHNPPNDDMQSKILILTISVQFDLIFDKKGMLSNKTKKCKI